NRAGNTFGGAQASSTWTASTPGADHTAQATIAIAPTGADWVGVCARAQNAGQDMYLAIYWNQSGSPVCQLYKRIAGTYTQMGANFSVTMNVGDTLKITAIGSSIVLRVNNVPQITVSDTSIPSGGSAGIAFYGSSGFLDNFVGG